MNKSRLAPPQAASSLAKGAVSLHSTLDAMYRAASDAKLNSDLQHALTGPSLSAGLFQIIRSGFPSSFNTQVTCGWVTWSMMASAMIA